MKKYIWIVVAVLVVGGIWYGVSQKSGVEVKPTIKIGVILPLTGDTAYLGESGKNAILLAKEKLVNTKYNYEPIFEDDRMDPKTTVSALNKLISIDKIDAVISLSSGPGNVVSPLAEQNKIIHFGIASDSNIAKGKYNFIHWTTPSSENEVLINELKNKNITKLGVFRLQQQGVTATFEEFQNKIKNTDIKIISDQIFNSGEKDFRTLILKIKKDNPEMILLLSYSPEIEILTKQIKEAGVKIPLTSIESFEYTDQPALFEGLWYVQAADPTEKFASDYKAKFDKDYKATSPNEYDAFNMIVKAYEEAGDGKVKPATEAVLGALHQISNYDGALGKLSVGADNIVNSKAVVRMIKNGKPVTISQ